MGKKKGKQVNGRKCFLAATANDIFLDIMTWNIDWDQRNLPDTKEKGDSLDTLLGENQKNTFGETKNGKSAAAGVDSPELCSPSCLL